MDETRLYATVVMETTYPQRGEAGPTTSSRRLVCVDASTPEHARRESGLVEATFHEATEEERDEWFELTAEDLDPQDLIRLERLVRSELVQVGNKRLRDVALGLTGERQDRDLGKAIRLAMLRGKLLAWLDDLEAEREEEAA